jgi:hypothetical protein
MQSGISIDSASKVVYVCHPFGAKQTENISSIRKVCCSLLAEGCIPLAPQLFLPQFLDEAIERDRALSICLRLVAVVDELRVYGKPSAGMRIEIAEARRLGILVVEGRE